ALSRERGGRGGRLCSARPPRDRRPPPARLRHRDGTPGRPRRAPPRPRTALTQRRAAEEPPRAPRHPHPPPPGPLAAPAPARRGRRRGADVVTTLAVS